MLHAKTLTVDGAWASVGSNNFSNRSLSLICFIQDRKGGKAHVDKGMIDELTVR